MNYFDVNPNFAIFGCGKNRSTYSQFTTPIVEQMKKSQLKITHAQKGSKHTKFVEDLYAIEDEDNDEYSDSETSDDDNKETTLQQDDFFTFQSSKSKTSDQTLSDLQLLDKRQTEKLMQSCTC